MSEPLIYARKPRRPSSGQFSGLYVTLGAIGVVVGGGFFLLDGLSFSAIWVGWAQSGAGGIWFPIHALIPLLFGILCDLLVVGGAVISFWRFSWARQMLRGGLAGEIVLDVIFGVAFFREAESAGNPQFYLLFMAIVFGRGLFAVLFYFAYSNMRADFYFEKGGEGVVLEQVPILSIGKPKGRPTGRFLVTGIDGVTRAEMSYVSNALTEESAMRGAVMLGLERETVKVRAAGGEDGEEEGHPRGAGG
jgi:hypothetical protein